MGLIIRTEWVDLLVALSAEFLVESLEVMSVVIQVELPEESLVDTQVEWLVDMLLEDTQAESLVASSVVQWRVVTLLVDTQVELPVDMLLEDIQVVSQVELPEESLVVTLVESPVVM
jgi:hypothetical protein